MSLSPAQSEWLQSLYDTLQDNPSKDMSYLYKDNALFMTYQGLKKDVNELTLGIQRMQETREQQSTIFEEQISTLSQEERQLRYKRNDLTHSQRKQEAIMSHHIALCKKHHDDTLQHMDDELTLQVQNIQWKMAQDTANITSLCHHLHSENEQLTKTLMTFSDDYDRILPEQEEQLASLTEQVQLAKQACEEKEMIARHQQHFIQAYHTEEREREDAKRQMELQLAAIVLLQRWYRKCRPPVKKPKKKKK